MDDALKARLIGASILVLLAVALLPELLSGPKAPAPGEAVGKGARVVTIDLGGAVAASRAPRADVTPEPVPANPAMPAVVPPATTAPATPDDTSEPAPEPVDEATVTLTSPPVASPAAGPLPAPAQAAAPKPTVAEPAPKPAPAAEPTSRPAAGSGKYAVQVGAFSSAEGARKLVGELKGAGFPAYVLMPAPGKKLHRVRVGPVADRAAADQLASRLKSRGLPVAVTSDG